MSLGKCPTCGTELMAYRTKAVKIRPPLWCWKCERVLRPGEARKARDAASASMPEGKARGR